MPTSHWSELPPRFSARRRAALWVRLVRSTVSVGGCRSVLTLGRKARPRTLKRTTNAIMKVTTITSFIAHLVATLHGATPTLTYESPLPLTAAGAAINLGNHAAPRLVDWNNDGVLDLLVAGGDGYIWLFRQSRATNATDFLPGIRVTASGSPIRVGTSYTGACFADIDGDGLPDLIVAGNDNRVRYYRNKGVLGSPAFEASTVIQGNDGVFALPWSVYGRIEIADWDADGLLDLLTGDWGGEITWYRNTGTTNMPVLGAAGVRMSRGGTVLHEPHNVHPRVFDFNQDRVPDLAFGINWGYVKILMNSDGPGATDFPSDYRVRDTNGAVLNIRGLISDDTIPDFADLNGDNVLDLISGGANGRLFFMAGVSYTHTFERIEAIMAPHTINLGTALAEDPELRDTLFGLHRSLRSLAASGLLPPADRETICAWYRGHIARYPNYLRRRNLDQTVDAYVPYLAGQVWVNLFESVSDTPAHRRETAMACGFNGTISNLLTDLGMLYVENSLSTGPSQRALYDIAASIPTLLQIVDLVTQNDFLRPPGGSSVNIEARRGVNVFAQVGDFVEGFPPDVPQTLIDGFSVVIAHELNHNVEHAAGQLYPWFWDRKFDLLEQAAPPHLVFRDHNTAGFGLDLPATQSNFLAHGYWDGVEANWKTAYDTYWASGPGAGYNRRWLRDNLKDCLAAPQEAFATLANQYFTSSEVMLKLAVARWQQGITNCINQFLFFADVYSLGSNQTFFYRIDTSARVTRSVVPLQRDMHGHISGLTTTTTHYEFLLDSEGNVLDFHQTPVNVPMPRLVITPSGREMLKLTLIPNPSFRLVIETSPNLRAWTPWRTNDPFGGLADWNIFELTTQHFYRARRAW